MVQLDHDPLATIPVLDRHVAERRRSRRIGFADGGGILSRTIEANEDSSGARARPERGRVGQRELEPHSAGRRARDRLRYERRQPLRDDAGVR